MRERVRQILLSVLVNPLAVILIRLHVGPNFITLLGLILSFGVAYLFMMGYFVIAGVGLLFAGMFDVLDGAVARISKDETKIGSVLDSLSDRIAESCVFFGLMVFYLDKGELPVVSLVFLAALLGFLVSYTRAKAELLDISDTVGLVTRPERVILLAIGGLSDFMPLFLLLIVVGSLITFVQRFVQILDNTKD